MINTTYKIIKIIIENTPIDFILGELSNDKPWDDIIGYYKQ